MTTAIIPVTDLSKAAKQKAARAIENVHLAYYVRGGVRDTEEKLAEQRGAAARHIYSLAVYASEQSRTKNEAIALFSGMCLYAEALYKEQHTVENLKEALPTWATLKSNILRGVRTYELDPIEYRSEGAFRIAMQKKAQLALLPPPVTESTKGNNKASTRVLSAADIDKLLSTTIQLDSIRVLLAQVVFECEVLKKGSKSHAEAILRKAMDQLAAHVDQRKVA